MSDNDKPAMVSVMTSLPEDVYEWLREYARDLDISMSSVLRSLVIGHRSDMRNAKPTETAWEVFESGRDCEPDGSVVDVLGDK
jgi:hypothetical protein